MATFVHEVIDTNLKILTCFELCKYALFSKRKILNDKQTVVHNIKNQKYDIVTYNDLYNMNITTFIINSSLVIGTIYVRLFTNMITT